MLKEDLLRCRHNSPSDLCKISADRTPQTSGFDVVVDEPESVVVIGELVLLAVIVGEGVEGN